MVQYAGRDREQDVIVEVRIAHYGNPEQDAKTALNAFQAVSTALHANNVRARWKRKGEKTFRPLRLKEHG